MSGVTMRTGKTWIEEFAAELGVEAPDDETMDRLLEIAGVAAHASERLAAPIACWLIGAAGLNVAEALDVARRV